MQLQESTGKRRGERVIKWSDWCTLNLYLYSCTYFCVYVYKYMQIQINMHMYAHREISAMQAFQIAIINAYSDYNLRVFVHPWESGIGFLSTFLFYLLPPLSKRWMLCWGKDKSVRNYHSKIKAAQTYPGPRTDIARQASICCTARLGKYDNNNMMGQIIVQRAIFSTCLSIQCSL